MHDVYGFLVDSLIEIPTFSERPSCFHSPLAASDLTGNCSTYVCVTMRSSLLLFEGKLRRQVCCHNYANIARMQIMMSPA